MILQRRNKINKAINLLSNIITRRCQKLHKLRNSTMINDNSGMLWSTRSYIGQCPCCLKLQEITSITTKWNIAYHYYKLVQIYYTCSCGISYLERNSTNLGTTPVLMTSSIGGLLSRNIFNCLSITESVQALIDNKHMIFSICTHTNW